MGYLIGPGAAPTEMTGGKYGTTRGIWGSAPRYDNSDRRTLFKVPGAWKKPPFQQSRGVNTHGCEAFSMALMV